VADAGGALAAVQDLLPGGEGCLIQPMVRGVEVLVGAVRDEALGNFVVLAPGGIQAELYRERAMRPAPVRVDQAAEMVAETAALAALLAGHRGRAPADSRALVELIARLSEVAAALGPRLGEIDLNPVIVGPSGTGVLVVDARVALEA
jgi:succinyl-CoA synthetase beta subunit